MDVSTSQYRAKTLVWGMRGCAWLVDLIEFSPVVSAPTVPIGAMAGRLPVFRPNCF
jgi:hypothetical protein